MTVRFAVPGEPKGKDRPQFVKATGKTYTTKKTRDEERRIRRHWPIGRKVPDGEPFVVKIEAYYTRPDTHFGRNRVVKDGKESTVPGTTGAVKRGAARDIDNVVKLVLDALNTHAWTDDSFCTGIMATKEWLPLDHHEGHIFVEVMWHEDGQ